MRPDRDLSTLLGRTMGWVNAHPIAAGLVLAFVAWSSAFFLVGGGHGWAAPFFVTPLLFAVYPHVFFRAAERKRRLAADAVLLLFAIAANIFLVGNAIERADQPRWPNELLVPGVDLLIPGVDRSVFPFFILWLALWVSWQLIALRNLFGARSDSGGNTPSS